ncbi:MAG: carbohydrate ABC transporter permease [Succinivibrio sp.]|nr:carbohydrate ABC transporter permease [Succinivibrio sp.]
MSVPERLQVGLTPAELRERRHRHRELGLLRLRQPRLIWLRGLRALTLLTLSVLALLPLYTLLTSSVMSPAEFERSTLTTVPLSFFNIANYEAALDRGQLAPAWVNTALIVTLSVGLTVLLGTLSGYALTRGKFRGRGLVQGLFLVFLLLPAAALQPAVYELLAPWGLSGSRLPVIILYAATDMVSYLMLWHFIHAVPRELTDALRLEGAGAARLLFCAILPQIKSAIAAVALLKTLFILGDLYYPLIYLSGDGPQTVATALYRLHEEGASLLPVEAAALVLSLLPLLLLLILGRGVLRRALWGLASPRLWWQSQCCGDKAGA